MPVSPVLMNESSRREAARRWLLDAHWHVAVMRGTRVLPSLQYENTDLPAVMRCTLRLFAPGCPGGLLRDVLQLLGEEPVVENPVVDGMPIPGKWYHNFAAWGRDSGQSVDGGDSTKTLIRDLNEGSVRFSSVSENSCSSYVSIRYVFDVPSVETLTPDAQGYQTRIGGVSRDQNSNLFSYYVTVSRRKTVYIPPAVVNDSVYQTDTSFGWTGLYGSEASPVDQDGNSVAVPVPGSQPLGTMVSLEWSKDPSDCTFSVRVLKRVAKENVPAGASCRKDLFEETDGSKVSAATSPLGHAPEPSNGLSLEYSSDKRPDGLTDNAMSGRQERTVLGARSSSEESLFSKEESNVDRSVTGDAPTPYAAGGVRLAVSVEKTPGALKTVSQRKVTEHPVEEASVSVRKDLFSTVTSRTDKSSSQPLSPPDVGLGVSGGSENQKTPGDLRDVSVEIRQENSVPAASSSVRETLTARETRTTDRSSSGAVPSAIVSAGLIRSVEQSRTPGDLRDIGVSEVQEKLVPRHRVSKSEDLFTAEEAVTDSSTPESEPSPQYGNGVRTAVEAERTQGDLLTVTRSTRTDKTVLDASTRLSVLPWAVIETHSDKAAVAPFTRSDQPVGTVENQKTPSGRYDRSRSGVVPGSVVAGSILSQTKGGNLFYTSTVTRTIETEKDFGEVGLIATGEGTATIREVSFTWEELGYYIKTEEVRTVRPRVWHREYSSYIDTARNLPIGMWHYSFRNADPGAVFALFSGFGAEGELQLGYSFEYNDFGLMDGQFNYKQQVQTDTEE